MKEYRVYEGNDKILYHPVASSRIAGDGVNPYIIWTLYPIAIWDYVDPDYSERQGWIQQVSTKGLFPNETYEILQYIVSESLEECLTADGYDLNTTSKVFYKDYINNPDDRAQQISVEDAIFNAMDVL